MKSKQSDLRRRGLFNKEDFIQFSNESYDSLINNLINENAYIRSVSIAILSNRENSHDEFYQMILNQLKHERALYTRLEICRALTKADQNILTMMISNLSEIGKNQYKELPKCSSKKKSYPLPRDIIARIIKEMDPIYIDYLIDELKVIEIKKARELIDAIGYIVFYNPQLVTQKRFTKIMQIVNDFDDEILYWKFITCLSGFPLKSTYDVLNQIQLKDNLKHIIREEVHRSLRLLQMNKV